VKPRITLSLKSDGELEIHLNAEGRDLLVRELQSLSERWDHFHLAPNARDGDPPDLGDVGVGSVPYNEGDRIIEYGKVLFRPDEWDLAHFAHVMVG